MSALSVLEILDRQIGNNYNAAPSYEQLQETRAAVAELIDEADDALGDIDQALRWLKGAPHLRESAHTILANSVKKLEAALARVGGGK